MTKYGTGTHTITNISATIRPVQVRIRQIVAEIILQEFFPRLIRYKQNKKAPNDTVKVTALWQILNKSIAFTTQ